MSAVLDEITSQYPMIHKASEQLERFSTSEDLQRLERRRKRFLCDKAQYIADAEKKAGAEGEARKALAIALNLKTLGFDLVTISQATGLSSEEIEALS